jgi:hypothetical protein
MDAFPAIAPPWAWPSRSDQEMVNPGGWEPVDWWWMPSTGMRGWFTDAYPSLNPFFPLPTADPAFIDPWTFHGYPGHWV